MRRDWTTHVSGIHLRDDFVCGKNDNEEAQNIQNLKCHDRSECWWKACKDQIGEWIDAETDRHLKKKSTIA